MRFAFFQGCKIPFYLESYGRSSRAVLQALGVELVDLEFNCCGYPVRHLRSDSFLLAAARNLALAEQQQVGIVTPCKCCFGSLKHAEFRLRRHEGARNQVNRSLREEGLRWQGRVVVKHLLSVLLEDVGLEKIASRVKRRYRRLGVAAHYGCHALRPGEVVGFDNPLAPSVFEQLIAATGAHPLEWSARLECCGAPLWEKNNPLSLRLATRKLVDAERAGAVFICTACTYCQIHLEAAQAKSLAAGSRPSVPSPVEYTRLLGLALGIDPEPLGMAGTTGGPQTVRATLTKG